jgi:hypothetical protein
VFDGAMIERLHDIYADLLAKWDCKLIEFNGEPHTPSISVFPRYSLEQIGEQY